MPKTVRLAIYFNDELRAVRELAVPFVIGRSHDVNLTIPHPMVSRRHCRIFEESGTFILQDLGSLNGTSLGQERITDMELWAGAEFLIGNIRFVFNPADIPESPVFPPVSNSDIVKAEVILETPDVLPPPLPPYAANASKPIVVPSSVAPPLSTTPSFIKPLPQFSPASDEEDGMLEFHDVIDLADIADKKTSSPTPLRE